MGIDSAGNEPNITVSARKLLAMAHCGLESSDDTVREAAESALSYLAFKLKSRSIIIPPALTRHVVLLVSHYGKVDNREPF